jgi:hypothetical protein
MIDVISKIVVPAALVAAMPTPIYDALVLHMPSTEESESCGDGIGSESSES